MQNDKKVWPFQYFEGKKVNGNFLWVAQMLDLTDKDFKGILSI